MATHGRTGEALAAHSRRKAKSHIVPGVYAVGGISKPETLTRRQHIRELQRRGKDQRHPMPYRCKGRKS